MKRFIAPCLGLVMGALLISACNVLDGVYEEGVSSDPDVLLEDARLAAERGEADKAVAYLNEARQHVQPGTRAHSEILLELSSATLQMHDVNVVTLQRLASDLVDQVNSASGVVGAGKFAAEVCSFSESAGYVRGEAISLDNIDGFTGLEDNQPALDSVKVWIAEAIDYEGPRPGEPFDIEAFRTQLEASGFSEAEIARAFLNLSIAYFGASYNDLVTVGADQITWYAVTAPGDTDPHLGYCAPSQQIIDNAKSETACLKGDLRFGVDLLNARADILGPGTVAETVAGKAEEAYDKLDQNLDATCTMP